MSTLQLRRVQRMRRRYFVEPAPEGYLSRQEWEELSACIFKVLEPHMEIRVEVAAAIVELEKRWQGKANK